MPTKKVHDLPRRQCMNPEHNPPTLRLFEPGVYEHTCPACGEVQRFTVTGVAW